jgi:hypothetical protein
MSLAEEYDLLNKEDCAYIRDLSYIRNRYAHSIVNHKKTIADIISEARDESRRKSILINLCYRKDISFAVHRPGIDEIEFGALMFLAGMSGRLRPPKFPPTGLLGALLSGDFELPPTPTESL